MTAAGAFLAIAALIAFCSRGYVCAFKQEPGFGEHELTNAPMFPELSVFHHAKDSSRLYFLLKTNELNVNSDKEKPTVSYKLQYVLYLVLWTY